jgi:hypothetical protein
MEIYVIQTPFVLSGTTVIDLERRCCDHRLILPVFVHVLAISRIHERPRLCPLENLHRCPPRNENWFEDVDQWAIAIR